MIILEAILGNVDLDIEDIKNLNNGDTVGLKENSFCIKENDALLEKQKFYICVSSNSRISLKPIKDIKINLDIENTKEENEDIEIVDNIVNICKNNLNNTIDKNNITNFIYNYKPEILSVMLEKKGIFISAFILANLNNKDFVFEVFNNFKDYEFKSEVICKISDIKETKIDYLILVFDLLKKELNKIKINDKVNGKKISLDLFERYKDSNNEKNVSDLLSKIEKIDTKTFNELNKD